MHRAPGDGRMGGPDGGGWGDGAILTLAAPYRQIFQRNFLHVITDQGADRQKGEHGK